MLDGTVLILIMTIELPVQRLGASRIAHRLPLDARRTRQPHGTPTRLAALPRQPLGGPEPGAASATVGPARSESDRQVYVGGRRGWVAARRMV